MANRPYVWKMVKEAVEGLGGRATNAQIKKYILDKYGDVKENTINCQILTCCVNKPSRINWPENHKPRVAIGPYDFLYSVDRGKVELYDRAKHGVWEIRMEDGNRLIVRQIEETVQQSFISETATTSNRAVPVSELGNRGSVSFWKSVYRKVFGK
jgi:hypothetical protein